MKRFFPFSILFLVLTAACNLSEKEGSFSQEELSWLVYQEGQEMIFTQADSNYLWKVSHRANQEQVKKYYPIEAEVVLQSPEGHLPEINKQFRIYLLKDKTSFKKYLRTGEIYRSLDLIKPLDSVEINGKMFFQVYEILEDTLKHQTEVYRVMYNRDYGILRYDTRAGVHYLAPNNNL